MSSEDQTLERWTGQRDPEAFRDLVARYSGMVYATCRRMLGDSTEAEDATQECFEALAEVPHFRIRGEAGPWLYGVATRRCLHRLRSERHRRAREQAFSQELATVREVADASRTAWADIYQHVDEAIAGLPEDLRAVVVAHYLCNERHGAVAKRLGIPRRTVSHRIKRGVEELGKVLRDRNVALAAPVLASLLAHNLADAAILSAAAPIPSSLAATLGKLALAHAASAGSSGPPAAAALTLVGVLAMKKLVITLVLLAAAAICGYLVISPGGLSKTKAPTLDPLLSTPTADEADVNARAKADAEKTEGAGEAIPGAVTSDDPGGAQEAIAQADQPAAPASAPGTSSISGRVVDADGAAVPGAAVAARTGADIREKPRLTATSDAKGRFTFAPLEPGRYNLGAFSRTSGYGSIEGVESGSDNAVITLKPTGRISGIVYDESTNEGVADAGIVALPTGKTGMTGSSMMLFFLQTPRSDARGRFDLAVVAPDEYLLLAKAAGYLEPDLARQSPIVLKEGEHRTDVRVPLTPGLSISGTVYAPGDIPLSGAQVELINQTRGSNMPDATASSGQDGTFVVDSVQPGTNYIVRATHPQFSVAESEPITLAPGEPRDGLELRLGEGHTAGGQVVFSDGRGVPGVKLFLRPPGDSSFAPIPFLDTTTDETGHFRIANVAAGTYSASVELHRGVGNVRTVFYGQEFVMPGDADVDDLLVDVGPALEGVISGTVSNAEDRPMANITVVAHSGAASGIGLTDENGAYRIEALGGAATWMMEVFGPPGYDHPMRADVAVNSENVDFRLDRVSAVSGVVSDATTRRPVVEFEVRIMPGNWSSYSAADGAFTISGAEKGNELEVRAQGYETAKIGPLAAQDLSVTPLEIALNPGESLQGVVVDSNTGEPVAGARVRLYTPDLNLHHLQQGIGWSGEDPITDEAGRFFLGGLPVGTPVSLLAWKQGYAPVVLPDTEDAAVTIPMGVGGAIEGAILRGGAPVKGLHIQFFRIDPGDGVIYSTYALTDAGGNFHLDLLPPGTYIVNINDSLATHAAPVWKGQIELETGEVTPFNVSLDEQ